MRLIKFIISEWCNVDWYKEDINRIEREYLLGFSFFCLQYVLGSLYILIDKWFKNML